MNRTIFWNRIANLRSFLSEQGLDSIWITDSKNRRYLSGFRPEDISITESCGSLLIGKKFVILITDPRYELEAKETVPDFELRIIQNDNIKGICNIIMEMDLKNVGFEQDFLSVGVYNRIEEEFKKSGYKIELIPLSNVVEKMREIKDEYEITAIKKAANMVCGIMEKLKIMLKEGVREKELAFKVQELAYVEGAEDLSFPPIVASGANSALPHATPTEKKIISGEPIIIDIGVRLDGYCSDITRTLFINRPTSEFEYIYSIVEKAQLSAIKAAKPGIKSSELDQIARDIIKEAGYGEYFSHGLGHGVGLSVHERPRINKTDSTVLMPGMVITIEPGIYIQGKGGIRLEEMILIKENGCEIITKR